MKQSRATIRYAKALLQLSIEQKSLEIAVQALHNEFKLDKK